MERTGQASPIHLMDMIIYSAVYNNNNSNNNNHHFMAIIQVNLH